MATDTSAELDAFGNLGESGLDQFEPEPPRDAPRHRAAGPSRIGPSGFAGPNRPPYVGSPRPRVWPFAVPVLVAASLVGAAVAWGNMRASEEAMSTRVRARASLAAPAAPALGPRDAAPPVSKPRSQPAPVSTPADPVSPDPGHAAPGRAEPAATAQPVRTALDPAIEQTLTRISEAYRTLDATSLTAVWPGADTSALSESFSALKYQTLTFEHCRVQPNGRDAAVATCDVSIAAAPKAGDPVLQRHRESWTLVLGRAGDQWTVAGLTMR